jgi:hypothetical protein
MLDYMRQVAICESVRETIKQALTHSDDANLWQKVRNIPSTDGILREVSLRPNLDTEEKMRNFLMEQIMGSLRLTASQRDHLDMRLKHAVLVEDQDISPI